MKQIVPSTTIGIGLVLLVLGVTWTQFFRAESTWTDEKAQRSAEVKARMAYLGAKVNPPPGKTATGPDVATAKTEFDALKTENDELNALFHAVSETPSTVARYLRWTGIAIAACGLVGWYVANQSS